MPDIKKARAVGLNHVALEVGDIEEALAFYGRLFDFKLRSKSEGFVTLADFTCLYSPHPLKRFQPLNVAGS
ncbi:MAG: VOC family protein [Beijerinckiaceae bacterium]|jgi:lactoylglutathione lyase